MVRWAVGDEEGREDARAAVLPRRSPRLHGSSSNAVGRGTCSSGGSSDSQQGARGRGKGKKPGRTGVGPLLREWLNGWTFTEAIKSGNCELVRWMRVHGCEWPEDALADAAAHCSEELVEWMVAEGCPPEVRKTRIHWRVRQADNAVM